MNIYDTPRFNVYARFGRVWQLYAANVTMSKADKLLREFDRLHVQAVYDRADGPQTQPDGTSR
jgi:hypothetical protein